MNPADEKRCREIAREEIEATDGDGAVEASDSEIASLRGTVGSMKATLNELSDAVEELQGEDDGEG